jgi:K+-transporting ATPase ATPase C chain
MKTAIASLRLVVATMIVCVVGYAAVIWAAGQALTPAIAVGSLITAEDGTIIGSRLIAQSFTQPRYFWPRPSAVDYNGAGAGGSNKSPTSPDLTTRAREIVARYGATEENPLPPDLVAASGGGLDPHISLEAALYQVARVAGARGLPEQSVASLVRARSFSPGGFLTLDRIVNVLELNLALDQAAH